MVELKRQLSSEEEVPKEAVTATVTSPIDSHSIWHSIRLTDIDFESLNWGQIDPPVTEKSPTNIPQTQRGVWAHLARCLSHPDRNLTSYAYYLYNIVPSRALLYWD